MATKRTKRDAESPPNFETALERLELIVRDLEDGDLGLDQSLERYEEGVKYLKFCHQKLKETEQKIELLTGLDAEGNPAVAPFDDPATTLEEKQESRAQRRSRPKKQPSASKKQNPAEPPEQPDVDIQPGLF